MPSTDLMPEYRMKRNDPTEPVKDVPRTVADQTAAIRNLGRRPYLPNAGANDQIDLPDLALFAEMAAVADRAFRDAVAHLRQQGCSWSEIGNALGVSKQAAAQRFGK